MPDVALDSEFLDLDVEQVPPPSKPQDPALAAARIMLTHALTSAGVDVTVAGGNGAVCLIAVPNQCWVEIVVTAWRLMARDGRRPGSRSKSWHSTGGDWTYWSPDEAPRRSQVEDAEAFACAASMGQHCVGVAADVDWLPEDLVLAADHRLTLAALTGADVHELARTLCGTEPGAMLANELTAMLTPQLLRLARRPGQTPDAYISKLANVLERHRTVKVQPAAPRQPTLDDLPGMSAATAWGRDLARDLDGYRRGDLRWADVDRGVLLYGPPGTGKTTFARALAGTCGVPLTVGSLGQWQAAGHLGDLLKAMRNTFSTAGKVVPCILFVDEVDGFGDRASFPADNRDYSTQVVNAFLELLDGATGREGVVVVGACNNPERIDPAITRSGRLDRAIEMPLPDVAALKQIFRVHLGDDLADVDLSGAALEAVGGTGADCERWVRGARRRARSAGRRMVFQDLMAEFCIAGRAAADDRRVACHEAGHALVSALLHPGSVVRASIRSAGAAVGNVVSERTSKHTMTAAELDEVLQELLAGRAAEEVVLGDVSTGAGGGSQSDLARATAIAVAMDMAYGLGGGLLWAATPDADVVSLLNVRPDLARRVSHRLNGAYEAVTAVVRAHRAALDAIAGELVERGTLSGDDIKRIMASVA